MRFLIRLYSALQIPIAICNALGGVVGAAWLFWLGEWRVVLISLVALICMNVLIGIVLFPRLLFMPFSEGLIKRNNSYFTITFFSLIHLYTTAVITASAFFTFYFFIYMAARHHMVTQYSILPFLLLTYEVATEPWASRARDDMQTDPHSNSVFGVFFLTIACIITALVILFGGASIWTCLWILTVTMMVSWVVQVVISVIEFNAERKYAQRRDAANGYPGNESVTSY